MEPDSRWASPSVINLFGFERSYRAIALLTGEVGRRAVNAYTVLHEWAHAREGSHRVDNLRSVSAGDWLS